MAPPITSENDIRSDETMTKLVMKAFVPPSVLITLVLGSIFFGWATPTEASGIGAAGAILLAIFNGRFNLELVNESVRTSAYTIGMVFLIIISAACFSYVFRSLGGEDVIHAMLDASGLGPWGIFL
jgi:TRAP-type mannitol/chloroaromatic compound transport system permease large subunit